MRAFLAIKVPPKEQAPLLQVQEQVKRSKVRASWVRAENLHLTLRFLGEIDQDRLEKLSTACREICAATPALRLRLAELGAFPNLKRPTILWAGLNSIQGDLEALQRLLEQACEGVGLSREKKTFHPHVTLARVKDPHPSTSLRTSLEQLAPWRGGAFEVGHVSLFESRLKPSGAEYYGIKEFPLAWK